MSLLQQKNGACTIVLIIDTDTVKRQCLRNGYCPATKCCAAEAVAQAADTIARQTRIKSEPKHHKSCTQTRKGVHKVDRKSRSLLAASGKHGAPGEV